MPNQAKQYWFAEQCSTPEAKNDGWAIYYDPTPGGKKNADGTTSHSLRFPALLLSEFVSDPEKAATEIAALLNKSDPV